jgi:uncharacterized protein YlbG (UPF0298 family)
MKNKSSLIIWIGTGKYIEYIDEFVNGLHFFQPKKEKFLMVMTDNENISRVVNLLNTKKPSGVFRIDNTPWPIVTLLKFHHIRNCMNKVKQKVKQKDFDEVYYFNANAKFIKKLNLNYDTELVGNVHWAWKFLNDEERINLHDRNKNSFSYIENPIICAQASFFGGKFKSVKKMADKICMGIELDLKKNVIPKWHDESHFNKYYHDYPEKFTLIPNFYGIEEKPKTMKGKLCILRDSAMTENLKYQ